MDAKQRRAMDTIRITFYVVCAVVMVYVVNPFGVLPKQDVVIRSDYHAWFTNGEAPDGGQYTVGK